MRKLINLIEAANGPDQQAVEYHLTEGCGAFAYAIWVAKGKPANGLIGIISNPNGESWARSIPHEVTHAFYADPTSQKAVDITGAKSLEEMKLLAGTECRFVGTFAPDVFKRKFTGMTDSKPFYCNTSMINDALTIIRAYPTMYGIIESAQINESVTPPAIVYHGSKTPAIKDFEHREGSRFVLWNEVKVKANGFYFAETPQDAADYGKYVGEYRIRCNNPLIYDGFQLYRDAKRRADLRYILSALFEPTADPDILYFEGMLTVHEVTREQLEDDQAEWVSAFVLYDSYGSHHGLEWEVLDNPTVAARMRERGYDSTTVFEPDHKGVKHSWFVLSPQQIEYIGPYTPDHDDEDDY